ncbi:MAG TPA: PilZ domain-containing protein [Egibacteraceae bacterium]|nr:PilZ domain-containing protein [Egibacteraceae bacterium]
MTSEAGTGTARAGDATAVSQWPDVNTLAFVDILDEPVMLESRVEAVEDGHLVLTAPTGAFGMPVLPLAGETLVVAWNTMRGHFERKGVVASSRRTPKAQVTVRALGEARRVQRRAHVRVPQLSPIALVVGPVHIRASLLDVSESGVRCVVDRPCPIGMDTRVEVTLELLNGVAVPLTCVPARMYAIDDEQLELGLTFVDIDDVTATEVRRHVFAQQVRDRAMGLL